MAKVTNPSITLTADRKAGQRIILKDRKEGLTISWQSFTKKIRFFNIEQNLFYANILTARYDNLSPQQKQDYEDVGKLIYMDGETYFRTKEKKAMDEGSYKKGYYNGIYYYGILRTKYSYEYDTFQYKAGKYRNR